MQEPLVLRSGYAELARLHDWIENLEAGSALADRDKFRIEMALTEAVTNIMDSAASDDGSKEIRIKSDLQMQAIAFEITDEGLPFNILEAVPNGLPSRLEDAGLGGHGIRLIRNYTDEIRYVRDGSINRLVLIFKTSGTPQGN